MNYSTSKFIGLLALGVIVIAGIFWWARPYFAGLRLINPIMFQIGSISIHWYGLLMALSVVIAVVWLDKLAKKTPLEPHTVALITSATLGGIIGARLLFVILKWPDYAGSPGEIFNLPGGGLSIHGALIGGAWAVYLYCRSHRLSYRSTADLLIPLVALGQMIGRWGNFFNQEAFGGPTNLPWKMYVAPEFRPYDVRNYSWFHPTFLYESLGLGIILLILLWWRRKQLPQGSIILIYLGSYSILRFGIEFFRIDSDYWGALSVAQWASLAIILLSLIGGLILRHRSSIKK